MAEPTENQATAKTRSAQQKSNFDDGKIGAAAELTTEMTPKIKEA